MNFLDDTSRKIETICVAVLQKDDGVTLPMEIKRKRFETQCKKISVSKKLMHHIYHTILQLNDK